MKIKSIFTCDKCKFESGKWLGKCPNCEEWNTFTEKIQEKISSVQKLGKARTPQKLINSTTENLQNIEIPILGRIFPSGIDSSTVILLGGEPGIGKSTLAMQIAPFYYLQGKKVLYVSGEENLKQVGKRAERFSVESDKIDFIQENNLENILETINEIKPNLVIIDSIQVINSELLTSQRGSIQQTRSAVERILESAKKNDYTTILIGHVTKDGYLAGPKLLEHLVDVVLQIDGERHNEIRILRTLKNRFGATNEVIIFEMKKEGLMEIKNPSERILKFRKKNPIGSALTCIMEGKRPLIVEVQALTTKTTFGYPVRQSSGYDLKRLNLLLAVMQKYLNAKIQNQDIYINIAGGFKTKDTGIDLAVIAAIISSLKNKILKENEVYLGEVGLGGEIRGYSHAERRIKEIESLNLKIKEVKNDLKNLFLDTKEI